MAKGSYERRGLLSWRLYAELGVNALGGREREKKTVKIEDPNLIKASKLLKDIRNLEVAQESDDVSIVRAAKKLQEHLDMELARFKIEIESGETQKKPERMKFSEFSKLWRKEYAPSKYSARAFKGYTERLDSHVDPFFERLYMSEITPLHILEFKNYLATPEARKDGRDILLSPSSQLFIFKVLTAILGAAVDLNVITKDPSESIAAPKVPKNKKKAKDVYSEKEAITVMIALLRYVQLWRLYFFAAMFGGYRRGELVALEWDMVDFSKNRFYISRSIAWTEKGKPMVRGTKEENEEWVAMPKWFMRDLADFYLSWREERLKVSNGEWYGGQDEFGNDKYQYVFHSGSGKPYYHDTPTATWRRFLKSHGLRHIKLHGLRHTAATLLAEDGVSLSLIQGHLRHDSNETTDEFYSHFTDKAGRAVADHFEKFDPQTLVTVGTNWGQGSTVSSQIAPFNPKRKKQKPI
ncbi:tyrosine-type recombinase/integrase [Cohnella abietis]|uniref:Site-specific integrase n=1 Tax=Cohnella abietis TaxID=2507935 RepID=A0A3T1D2W4_9BACL|nr:site-specific integrase [Cohnella abietis]BBI32446.1 site-specific integrase [Cohnella abietis]